MFCADCLLYWSSLATFCYGSKSLDWISLLLYKKQNIKNLLFFTPSGYTLNKLFVEMNRGLGYKKSFVRYHLFHIFFINCYQWLKLMTCSYTWREQILRRKRWLCLKKDDRQKSRFFYCKQRNRFIFRHLSLKKALKDSLQNIYLLLDLCH